ncbi:MAG: Arylsulfatase [Paenibacillaceae bacterium]|nr:Arylsulfatase [Paenibacillaceae bacterium]
MDHAMEDESMNKQEISAKSGERNRQPNLLLLLPDQHRGDWLPYSGDVLARFGRQPLPLRMPHVERLMREGTVFTRAVTPSPLCAPARACLASGLRYDHCGVPVNRCDYPLTQRTIYSALREAGYSTGTAGKLDLHKKTGWWGLDGWIPELKTLGFTHGIDNAGKKDAIQTGAIEPKDPYMKFLHDRGLADVHVRDIKRRSAAGPLDTDLTPLPDDAYCDNWLTGNALHILRSFPVEKPWFLQVNFTGPHDPWDVTAAMKAGWDHVDFPPPVACSTDLLEAYNRVRQNYAAMLQNIDRNIGLILDEVQARGDAEHTIVIYSSDHGEMLGDFDRFSKQQPELGSVHVPLVFSGPGIPGGVVSDALIELQDLTATLAEYAGVSMPEARESISMKPLIEGKTAEHRATQYSSLGNWRIITDGRYKLIAELGKEDRLYDVQEDPWETNNVAADHGEIVQKLAVQLEQIRLGNPA